MSTQLCLGRPSDWWDVGDGGNRLATAICRACDGCPDADPDPRGVIREGVAYSDAGNPLAECDTCGYPMPGAPAGGRQACTNCALPSLSLFAASIREWKSQGLSDRECGARVGASAEQVREARRRYAKAPRGSEEELRSCGGDADETAVERALSGERVALTDAELVAAVQAGVARGIPLSRLSNQLGLNSFAARKLLDGQLTPGRAKRQRVEAELAAAPHLSDYAIAARVGVGRPTVVRARRRMAERGQQLAS